jgi:hypothetical protein
LEEFMRRSAEVFFCGVCGTLSLEGHGWRTFEGFPQHGPPSEEEILEMVGDGAAYEVTTGCCPRCQELEGD